MTWNIKKPGSSLIYSVEKSLNSCLTGRNTIWEVIAVHAGIKRRTAFSIWRPIIFYFFLRQNDFTRSHTANTKILTVYTNIDLKTIKKRCTDHYCYATPVNVSWLVHGTVTSKSGRYCSEEKPIKGEESGQEREEFIISIHNSQVYTYVMSLTREEGSIYWRWWSH